MIKFTLFSLLALLAWPLPGSAQEPAPYPDVWPTAGTRSLSPEQIRTLIGLIGPGVEHRTGGCIPGPHWGKGNRADTAAAELVQVGSDAIEGLAPLLQDKDAKRRRLVVEILGRIGDRSATPLLKPLMQGETDEKVRESLAESLAMLRDPQAEETLIQALQDKNAFVQEDAARGLGWLKSAHGIPALIALLRKTSLQLGGMGRSPSVGETAARALQEIGAPALPALLGILADPTASVSALVFAMPPVCALEGRQAIPDLQRLLEHPEDYVRYTAVEQLKQWPSALPVPTLVHLLHGPPGLTLSAAGDLLAERGSEVALAALAEAFVSPDESVRQAAGASLHHIRSSDAVPMLIHLLQTGTVETQHHAAAVLGTLQDARAIPPLLQALASPDSELRRITVVALGSLETSRTLDALLQSLEDPQASVRIQTILVLREKHDARILPAFQRMAEDKDPAVRKHVATAIWLQQKALPK